jgi:hypothetical protein
MEMIFDPKIEVTCDAVGCDSNEFYEPKYVYHSMSGKSGQYDTNDTKVETWLKKQGWVVRDGKHYCCQECADSAAE